MKNVGLTFSIILLVLQFSTQARADIVAGRLPAPQVNSDGTVLPNLSLIQAATLMEIMQELSKPGNRLIWLCGQDLMSRLQNQNSSKKLTPECRSELNRILTKEYESQSREIVGLSTFITRGLVTNEEKTSAIYEWVTKSISYDVQTYTELIKDGKVFLNNSEIISPLNTIRSKIAVAESYSILLAALLRASNIPAVSIVGVALKDGTVQGTHAWNEVYLSNRWLNLDATWDAGVIKGNLTEGLRFESRPAKKYFDMPDAEFKKTHKAILDIR